MSDLKRIEEERKKGEELEKKIRRWIIPLIVLILIIVFWFSFEKPSNTENPDSEVYKFPKNLIIDKNWSFNFSNHLLPLLIKEKNTSAPYIFYIGSGAGSLPEGLVLNANGMLAGKPTGNGGTFTFEVCVEDSMGNILCKIYKLNVGSEIDENSGENQVTDKGESTSSWTGTYTIESLSYYYEELECKNKITGEIHFELTQKSNGEFEGIITTEDDKESITKFNDYSACLPYIVTPLELDTNENEVPFWLSGTINDAGGLNIDYFDVFLVPTFSSFTANRVGDTLTSEHVEVNEYNGNSQKLTFSVTKDTE